MANTFIEYTGNGSTTNYSFTFEYIKEAEVKVTLDGTASTAFTFANATTLSFTTAPASGVKIRIYRETDVSSLKATFFAGSAIKAEDLNDNFTQNNFAVEELRESTWDTDTETIKSNETWVSSDEQIATTAAMDARFQDEAAETITSSETWPNNDDTIATTAAIDDRIDTAITNDIGTDGTGITVTDDGDGTITLGLADDSVDFDKIKDADQIKLADQVADYDNSGSDDKVFTSLAAIRRFENYVQTSTPTPTAGIGKGAVWLDNDQDLTLSVWSGSAWIGVASGGTFTNQPKVVYVDATSGDDNNDGHRISRPKQTIKAAINQINADSTYGDGSVVVVAAGVYQEAAPIQIQKKNVSIIGQALRSCIVHPTVATQGDQSSGNHALFELNSGSFIQNLTLTGMKAGSSGTNTVDSVLPAAQGWNFAFYSGATITKSPYIQNCTNFSDSEIDNSNLNANTPAGGLAGDTDSAPTGGGMLIDGSVVDSASPLRSMVADSYTHVGLNGPGILVTNNGYCQATSSYAFFNKYHIKALNGGQANLAASTTDFGERALVADGKSTTAIFTASTTAAAADGDVNFTIDAPVADASWFGTAERPASNMLVTLNSVTYPVLSAIVDGSGWRVTISRPNPSNKSENLGLNGAVTSGSTASFFLRSMIASSGHTMEYVGSGTDYSALPENGGVPDDTAQITELNDGKIWTATTDHNGKFVVGPLEVDQRTGNVSIAAGTSISNVVNDTSPQLGGDLDANNFNIILDSGTAASPSLRFESDADTGLYTPGANAVGITVGGTEALQINSSKQLVCGVNPVGSGGVIGIGTSSPSVPLDIVTTGTTAARLKSTVSGTATCKLAFETLAGSTNNYIGFNTDDDFVVSVDNQEVINIDGSNRDVGIGKSSPTVKLDVEDTATTVARLSCTATGTYTTNLKFQTQGGSASNSIGFDTSDAFKVVADGTEVIHAGSNGRVGIGTSDFDLPEQTLDVRGSARIGGKNTSDAELQIGTGATGDRHAYVDLVGDTTYTDYGARFERSGGANGTSNIKHRGTGDFKIITQEAAPITFATSNTERARIDTNGALYVGETTGGSTALPAGTVKAKAFNTRTGHNGSLGGNVFNINWTGSVADLYIDNTNVGTFSFTSDYRVKDNIVSISTNCIDRIKQLRPVQYQYADYGEIFIGDGVTREGFIAHEVAEVISSGVEGAKDDPNKIQSLKVDAILSVTVKALQEAITKIETLETKVAALEAAN